jgi:hypothetical protein
MADNCTSPNRITSQNLVMEYTPCGDAAVMHEVELEFVQHGSDPLAGAFVLWVDGHLTAPITYNATVATLATSVGAAIDAVLPATFTVAAVGGKVNIVADAVGYHRILGLLGTLVADKINVVVLAQGTQTVSITSQASSFSWEDTIDTTDATALNQFDAVNIPVKGSMTFEISLFRANLDWDYFFHSAAEGQFTIYEEGKVTGKKYFAFNALLDSDGGNAPDHDKMERTISGSRQGSMVVPFNSYYVAAA